MLLKKFGIIWMNLDKIILQGKGIFVFSDPAGANSIFAIIDFLLSVNKKSKKDFLIFTNCDGVFEEKYKSILEIIDFSNDFCLKIQRQFKPEYLFSATSNDNFEHLWRKYFQKKIKVYSFIDHWCNYFKRFNFENQTIFGDVIFVLDRNARLEAIKDGIPKELIKILKNPYYQKVKSFKPSISKFKFFKENKLNINKSIILFISDYISTNFNRDKNGNCELGYDEFTVLSDLLFYFNQISSNQISKFQIVIKIHPRAQENKFDKLLKKCNVKNIDIKVIKNCHSLTINYFSNYVIGMFSNMVIESFLLKKKILRVQTGQKGDDMMKFEKLRNNVVIKKTQLQKKMNTFLKIK